jgi:hypothetical protein
MIYPITVSTANVGSAINPAYSGNSPSQANAIGYNSVNGKFYYFKRNCNTSPQEFVAFDPMLMTYSIKTSCPTTNTIHCGCASANGQGYYALDVNSNLYYYSIFGNTWTLITNSFTDQFSNNVSTIISNHTAGDLAIDGNGNLWILCSSNSEYGLYKVPAPLPTTAQANIVTSQYLALTPTPDGNSFAGIAFNPTGQLFLSTLGSDKLFRLENNYSLTLLGTFNVSGVGNDLTSCSFPNGVLAIKWEGFSADLKSNGNVLLNWSVSNETNTPVYYVEHSTDGSNWQTIGSVQSNSSMGVIDNMTFTHYNPGTGVHQYRIRMRDETGIVYSEVKTITIKNNVELAVWPNPAKDAVYIQTGFNTNGSNKIFARIFDASGKQVKEAYLQQGVNTVSVSSLLPGIYMMQVQLANGEIKVEKLVKQ